MMNVPTQLRPDPTPAGPADAPGEESAPTRHLSAAAYLDASFRHASLREVYYQTKRVVAPSFGFRLPPVLWHCLRARQAAVVRDSTILAMLLVSACLFVPLFSAALFLTCLHLAVLVWRFARATLLARPEAQVSWRALRWHGIQVAATLSMLAASCVFLVLAAAVTPGIAMGTGFGGLEEGTDTLALVGWSAFMIPFMFLLPPVVTNLWTQSQLDRLVPGKWAGTPRSPRLDAIERQQSSNTTVYSDYHPFVGAGGIVDSWGFSQRLVRRDEVLGQPRAEHQREFPQAPFTALDIVAHVRQHLRALAEEATPERRLPGLRVEDRVFLAGTEVNHLSPVTPPDVMEQIIQHPVTPARHYLTCRVESWRGELVTSVHVHFAVQGRTLYLELTTTALPPCDERYRVVDQVDGTGAAAYGRAFLRAIAEAPRTVAFAPMNLTRALADAVLNASQSVVPTALARGFDYGARASVRELGASDMTRNHIQTQDILKHKRIVERRVIATVLDFLESHEVDTSEYRQRALTILNAGAVNTGSGSMYVESAIGQQQNQRQPAANRGSE